MSALVRLKVGLVAVVLLGAGGVTAAVASGGERTQVGTGLIGYQEVPAVSSPGSGTFHAAISRSGDSVAWELTFGSTRGVVTQSHIHFGQHSVNGGIVVFLCSNLGNGPAGTQPCPQSGTISGTFGPTDVVGLAAAQGIAPGEFAEVVQAIRSGVAYANVHTDLHPGGEIRGQLDGSQAD